jgi:hypothetical protein
MSCWASGVVDKLQQALPCPQSLSGIANALSGAWTGRRWHAKRQQPDHAPAFFASVQRPFAFSDPFIMRVGPEETVGELRQRVVQQLGVPQEEAEASWKPVLCT